MLYLGNYKYGKYEKTIVALHVNIKNISKLLLFNIFIIIITNVLSLSEWGWPQVFPQIGSAVLEFSVDFQFKNHITTRIWNLHYKLNLFGGLLVVIATYFDVVNFLQIIANILYHKWGTQWEGNFLWNLSTNIVVIHKYNKNINNFI